VSIRSGCFFLPDPGLLLLDERGEPDAPVAEDPPGSLECLGPCGVVVRPDSRASVLIICLELTAAHCQGRPGPVRNLVLRDLVPDGRHRPNLLRQYGQVWADQMPDEPAAGPHT